MLVTKTHQSLPIQGNLYDLADVSHKRNCSPKQETAHQKPDADAWEKGGYVLP